MDEQSARILADWERRYPGWYGPEATHGHVWKMDEDGDLPDIFAFDGNYCNGPECTVCGYSACQHCVGAEPPPCEATTTAKGVSP